MARTSVIQDILYAYHSNLLTRDEAINAIKDRIRDQRESIQAKTDWTRQSVNKRALEMSDQ